jgi:hypothetical protein
MKNSTAFNALITTAISGILLVVGFGGTCLLIASREPGSPNSLFWVAGELPTAPPLPSDPEVDPSIAHPELSPEDVVRLQVQALNASKRDPQQMTICYSLASPSNRMMTGPLARFSQMAVSEPYHYLADADDWQVGTAVIEDRLAMVLVSVTGVHGEAFAYRFYLSRQAQAPFEGCWMTESVELLDRIAFE